MTAQTDSILTLSKRERRILIAGFVVIPFFYPFLLVWFAHAQLDKVYLKAKRLPVQYRAIAPSDKKGPEDTKVFKESALSVLLACTASLPNGSQDTLKSLRLLERVDFLPIIGRGFDLWKQIGNACFVSQQIDMNPEYDFQRAGVELHQAAANIDKALADYEQTRLLLSILLWIWLVIEICGWGVILYFARRYWRGRSMAKASSTAE